MRNDEGIPNLASEFKSDNIWPPFGQQTFEYWQNTWFIQCSTVFGQKGVKCYSIGITRPDLESSHHLAYLRPHLTWFSNFDWPLMHFRKKMKRQIYPTKIHFSKKMVFELLLYILHNKTVANFEILNFINMTHPYAQGVPEVLKLSCFRHVTLLMHRLRRNEASNKGEWTHVLYFHVCHSCLSRVTPAGSHAKRSTLNPTLDASILENSHLQQCGIPMASATMVIYSKESESFWVTWRRWVPIYKQ